ncbi:MAG: amino acid transporter permease [Microbacteriaceae bacterium]|jgi:polar amino acid transport system permease protein|nr:amino acid transporter permease [Microbacteriaceae bacterium]
MIDLLQPVLIGLPFSLGVATGAFLLGAILGVPIVALLRSNSRVARELTRLVVDIIRGVPIVVWLFVLYFGVSVGQFRFDALSAAVIGLGVVSAAYLAEVYRGALLSIPATQFEASSALGFSRFTTYKAIIAPQAIKVALPAATTFAIALLKDTSIASVIGVTEIAFLTQNATRASPAGLEYYAIACAAYIAMALPLGLLSRGLDRRLRRSGVTA